MDFQTLPPVEVADDLPPKDLQTRLVNWLADLNFSTTNIQQRLQLLAKYCYFGAKHDIRQDVREDISGGFDPEFERHLMDLYSPAQAHWVRLRGDPSWATIRRGVEGADPGSGRGSFASTLTGLVGKTAELRNGNEDGVLAVHNNRPWRNIAPSQWRKQALSGLQGKADGS